MAPPRIWTRESAIAALQAEAQRIGRTPTFMDLLKRRRPGTPGTTTYVRLFKSFANAQLEAGLRLNVGGPKRRDRCRSGLHAMRGANVAWHRSKSKKWTRQCRKCLRARQRVYDAARRARDRAAGAAA